MRYMNAVPKPLTIRATDMIVGQAGTTHSGQYLLVRSDYNFWIFWGTMRCPEILNSQQVHETDVTLLPAGTKLEFVTAY